MLSVSFSVKTGKPKPLDPSTGATTLAEKPKLARPPMYSVMMYNDDYTPMLFVVKLLESFFYMNRADATKVMLTIHSRGKASCGVFPRDIAATKSKQVNNYSRAHGHPLLSNIEPYLDSQD